MLRHLFNILRVQWSENTCDDGYDLDRNIDTAKIIPLLDRVQPFVLFLLLKILMQCTILFVVFHLQSTATHIIMLNFAIAEIFNVNYFNNLLLINAIHSMVYQNFIIGYQM